MVKAAQPKKVTLPVFGWELRSGREAHYDAVLGQISRLSKKQDPVSIATLINTLKQVNSPNTLREADPYRAMFTRNGIQENQDAIRLFANLIKHDNTEVADLAKKTILGFVKNSSLVRKNSYMAPRQTAAIDALIKFAETSNSKPEELESAAKDAAKHLGFLHCKKGDDGSVSRKTSHQKLEGFFGYLETTATGRLLIELLNDNGFHNVNKDLAEKVLNDKDFRIGLGDEITDAIEAQRLAQNPELTGYRRVLAAVVGSPAPLTIKAKKDKDEVDFLKQFGYGKDFKFSLAQFESDFIDGRAKGHDICNRDKAIIDLVMAYNLLSFRKAKLSSLNPSSSQRRSVQAIAETQQKLLTSLRRADGQDDALRQTILRTLDERTGLIFMAQSAGVAHSAMRSVDQLVINIAKDIKTHYGARAQVIDRGTGKPREVKTYMDIKALREQQGKALDQEAIALSESLASSLKRQLSINHDSVAVFEGTLENYRPTKKLKAIDDDQTRMDTIRGIKTDAGQEGDVKDDFFIKASKADLIKYLNTQAKSDPRIKYVVDNFERIYGKTLDELTDLVISRDAEASINEDDKVYRASQFVRNLQRHMSASQEKNNETNNVFSMERAVKSTKFDCYFRELMETPGQLGPEEEFTRTILMDMMDADSKEGFENFNAFSQLLFAEEPYDEEKHYSGQSTQAAKRTVACMELFRKILRHNDMSDDQKSQAINLILEKALGSKERLNNTGLKMFRKNIEKSLGQADHSYAAITGSSSSKSKFQSLMQGVYLCQDLDNDIASISKDMHQFINRESKLFLESLYDEKTASEVLERTNGESFSRGLTEMAMLGQSVIQDGEIASLSDFQQSVKNATGMDISSLSTTDLAADEHGASNFIFVNHPGFTHNGEDIFAIMREVWVSLLEYLQSNRQTA